VLRAPERVGGADVTEEDFLQRGECQVAAGYAVYGPQTILVLTLGAGVHEFTLDREIGSWVMTDTNMTIPTGTREFAINTSNARQWSPEIARFIEDRVAGEDGNLSVDYNMRWTGSMVADVHRILKRGGVFLYPRDVRKPGKVGKLRLMYEGNPMAMLMEQAGGAASDGEMRIMSIVPTALHQRVGFVMGDPKEVEAVTSAYRA
jgi:fructose-1,6-bisphosphatase I